jgi:hypothetical protein
MSPCHKGCGTYIVEGVPHVCPLRLEQQDLNKPRGD